MLTRDIWENHWRLSSAILKADLAIALSLSVRWLFKSTEYFLERYSIQNCESSTSVTSPLSEISEILSFEYRSWIFSLSNLYFQRRQDTMDISPSKSLYSLNHSLQKIICLDSKYFSFILKALPHTVSQPF